MTYSKEVFVSTIVAKMPQVDPSQLDCFYDYHAVRNCPPFFLYRVSQGFRYIPKVEIAQVAAATAGQLTAMMGEDYNAFFDKSRSSIRWAYERLLEGGLKSARIIFNGASYEHAYEPWENLRWEDPNIPLLIPDDWSIGAEQMTNWTTTLKNKKSLYLSPFFASRSALRKIKEVQSKNTTIVSLGEPFKTFDEIFDEEDYGYMEALYNETVGTLERFDQGMFRQFALVTSSHFTPDNFPGLFLGKRRTKDAGELIPGLIRASRPNYRRATYTNTRHGKQ